MNSINQEINDINSKKELFDKNDLIVYHDKINEIVESIQRKINFPNTFGPPIDSILNKFRVTQINKFTEGYISVLWDGIHTAKLFQIKPGHDPVLIYLIEDPTKEIYQLVISNKFNDLVAYLANTSSFSLPTNVTREQSEYMQLAYRIGWVMKYKHKPHLKKLCQDFQLSYDDDTPLTLKIATTVDDGNVIKEYIEKNQISMFIHFAIQK